MQTVVCTADSNCRHELHAETFTQKISIVGLPIRAVKWDDTMSWWYMVYRLAKVWAVAIPSTKGEKKESLGNMKFIKIIAPTRCQIRFRLGLHPRPCWGNLQHSPDPL